jgi:Putative methyltransferase
MTNEWLEWHRGYEEGKPQALRLRVVQDRIREVLDSRPPGPIRIVSLCAGDGRDLLGVLAGHPRARDVRARLVELTSELVEAGRERASREGLSGVEWKQGDASNTSAYAGVVPADLVLVCGVFGNISDQDVRETIHHIPELCARGATVIWTRGRFEPDLTPTIRNWFNETGFTEISFVTIPGTTASVGAHRLSSDGMPYRADVRLFTFLPYDRRPSTLAKTREAASAETPPP